MKDHSLFLKKLSDSLKKQGHESLNEKLSAVYEAIKPKYLFIATKRDDLTFSTYINLKDGHIDKNFESPIQSSPCEVVHAGKVIFFNGDLQERYPNHKLFNRLNTKSYLGVPLKSEANTTLGIFSALFESKVEDEAEIEQLFKVAGKLIESDFKNIYENLETQANDFFPLPWRNFLSHTLDHIPAVFYAKSKDGQYLHVNSEYLDLFNFLPNQIINKNDFQVFPQKIANQFRENDLNVIKSRKPQKSVETVVDKNGNKRSYNSYKFPYFNENGEVFATGGISIDITAEKQIESELETERLKTMHQAKLASIGETAAGIAHEINNPLAIVATASELIEKYLEDNDTRKIKDRVSKIRNAVDRTSTIIRSLRLYARDTSHEQYERLEIKSLINLSLDLISERLKSHAISLEVNYNSNANEEVECRPIHLSQAIINILINAYQAVKDLSEKWIKINVDLFHPTNHLLIRVIDSGQGIPKNASEKVFKPFFTTKSSKQGTGLGLSFAKTIVDEHEGKIYHEVFKSHTSFVIQIPLHKPEGIDRF